MPRASKRPVNVSLQIESQDNFALLISSLSSSRDIHHFFQTFLTDEEKTMLTKRLMLHLMLENGYDLSEITCMLGLSKDTIYRHKTVWSIGDETYKAIISKLAKRGKTKEFWNKIEKALRPVELALAAKTNIKARAKLFSGNYD